MVAELGCSVEFGRTPAKTEDGACALQIETGSKRPVPEVGQGAVAENTKFAEVVAATLHEAGPLVIHHK